MRIEIKHDLISALAVAAFREIDALENKKGEVLELDLKHVNNIDSAGVGMIQRCLASFQTVKVLNACPYVKEVLEVVGISQVISVEGL